MKTMRRAHRLSGELENTQERAWEAYPCAKIGLTGEMQEVAGRGLGDPSTPAGLEHDVETSAFTHGAGGSL